MGISIVAYIYIYMLMKNVMEGSKERRQEEVKRQTTNGSSYVYLVGVDNGRAMVFYNEIAQRQSISIIYSTVVSLFNLSQFGSFLCKINDI